VRSYAGCKRTFSVVGASALRISALDAAAARLGLLWTIVDHTLRNAFYELFLIFLDLRFVLALKSLGHALAPHSETQTPSARAHATARAGPGA